MKTRALLLVVLALFAVGCQTRPKAQSTLQRTWIGGDYTQASQGMLPQEDRHRVYVQQVYQSTPAAQAGLQPGDRVLSMNNRPIRTLKDLHRTLDSMSPGTPVTIGFLRAGTRHEGSCVAGKETYQIRRTFSLGLQASLKVDLWPDPDGSIFGILSYENPKERVELRSAQVLVAQKHPPTGPAGDRGEAGVHSPEGWKLWLGVIGVGSHRRILSQEGEASAEVSH